MAVIDPAKRDLVKDPARPGDWLTGTKDGRRSLRRVLFPGEQTSRPGNEAPAAPDARISH